ncbi:hypothetical protein BRADI_4g33430v3 [Brachypodium distachyon]|uniref:Uncharacterized protein n=1 Tax=Brachypodium distachyon TaxID=15368 RepID=I1IR61_BRADI|nr:hypothetical protein BRADI_4g33430v3 [Brachypodium distachyon]
MGSKSCSCCYVKAVFSRMKPRCLEGKKRSNETNTVKAQVRQDTLQDILYSQQSFEAEETGVPSPRRPSPKVRPLNLDYSYENNSPNVQDSLSTDRISLRSQNSITRRVSFRFPDESDIFIIPARKDPDAYSTDDESAESVSEEGIGAKRTGCAITTY